MVRARCGPCPTEDGLDRTGDAGDAAPRSVPVSQGMTGRRRRSSLAPSSGNPYALLVGRSLCYLRPMANVMITGMSGVGQSSA